MDKKTLKAEKRKITGRKVKKLRLEGVLPGNVYGKKVKSEAIQVSKRDFETLFKGVGETGLVTLQLGKEKLPVLIHNLQKDPVSDAPLHVDFLKVDLKEKVTAKVSVELTGESPAEKQSLGTVVLYINEVEVKALPGDLPEKFTIDISNLAEVDQAIHIKDLPISKEKVEITVDPETIIAKVEPPQKEEVITPPAPAEGEVPAEASGPEGLQPEGVPATEGGEKAPEEGGQKTKGEESKEEGQAKP